ncbi:MAG: hypothetical protein ACHP9Y_04250, partial [Gammaproteobacteria bacterium]
AFPYLINIFDYQPIAINQKQLLYKGWSRLTNLTELFSCTGQVLNNEKIVTLQLQSKFNSTHPYRG